MSRHLFSNLRWALRLNELLVAAFVAAGPAAADEPPKITVQLDSARVYEGQPIQCTVSIFNVDDAPPPQFAPSQKYDVVLTGGPMDRRTLTSINGRVTQNSRRTYSFRIVPRETGELTIPGPTLQVNGDVLKGPDQTVEVVPAAKQDVVYLEISVDRPSLYPEQRVTVTLTVTVRALPEPYENDDPMSVQRTPPKLTIPWIDRRPIPEGMEPTVPLEEWLRRIRSAHGNGFRVNDIGDNSFFALFENRAVSFRPQHSIVKLPNKDGIETDYWRYPFACEFRATRPGRYRFGPCTLEGIFATSLNEQGELEPEKIYVVARPLEIEVHEIPQQGRPESYIGAVGRHFQVTAEIAPLQARIRDPMTLSITVKGEGALDKATPPELNSVPAVAEAFKVYDATQESGEGFSRFTYSVRPLVAGTKAFPAIPIGCFDVDEEKYVVLHTPLIPIKVTAADRLTVDQIVVSPQPNGSTGTGGLETRREGLSVGQGVLPVSQKGLFANITDLSAVRDESIRPAWWFAGLAGMAGAYLALAGLVVVIRRRSEDRACVRRRGAPARARQRLRTAQSVLAEGKVRQGADLVRDATVGLVADVTDLTEAGLTGKDADEHLVDLGVEEPLRKRTAALLAMCDAAQFGASRENAGKLSGEAQEVVEALIQSLKRNRRFR